MATEEIQIADHSVNTNDGSGALAQEAIDLLTSNLSSVGKNAITAIGNVFDNIQSPYPEPENVVLPGEDPRNSVLPRED
jgi:hypothetical protein